MIKCHLWKPKNNILESYGAPRSLDSAKVVISHPNSKKVSAQVKYKMTDRYLEKNLLRPRLFFTGILLDEDFINLFSASFVYA